MSLNIEDFKNLLREQEEDTQEIENLKKEHLQLNNELKKAKLKQITQKQQELQKKTTGIDFVTIFVILASLAGVAITLITLLWLVVKY